VLLKRAIGISVQAAFGSFHRGLVSTRVTELPRVVHGRLVLLLHRSCNFGSVVPPQLKLRPPGFDITRDRPDATEPRWFTHPAHLDVMDARLLQVSMARSSLRSLLRAQS